MKTEPFTMSVGSQEGSPTLALCCFQRQRFSGVGAPMTSEHEPPLPHVGQAGVANDFGMPNSPILFKILQANVASTRCV
jgi:hypothetical protein